MNKISSYIIQALVLINLLASCKDSASMTWVVSTLAGRTQGYQDGIGTEAQFSLPTGVAVDTSGNVYVADHANHRIRKITPAGKVSTLAGDGSTTEFNYPYGVAVDSSDNIYVADLGNHRIRKITEAEGVNTLAGSGTRGYKVGLGSAAQFNSPAGVAVDSRGNVYVADQNNHRIRKITEVEGAELFAGSSTEGFANGASSTAQFSSPYGVAVDTSGNVYVADHSNHRIRKITPGGEVSTFAGTDDAGHRDGGGSMAQFDSPTGVAVDISGNVYVADYSNHCIRKITPGGEVSTIAGSDDAGHRDGGGSMAQFDSPTGVAVDTSGNLYVADQSNHRIRKIEYKVP